MKPRTRLLDREGAGQSLASTLAAVLRQTKAAPALLRAAALSPAVALSPAAAQLQAGMLNRAVIPVRVVAIPKPTRPTAVSQREAMLPAAAPLQEGMLNRVATRNRKAAVAPLRVEVPLLAAHRALRQQAARNLRVARLLSAALPKQAPAVAIQKCSSRSAPTKKEEQCPMTIPWDS